MHLHLHAPQASQIQYIQGLTQGLLDSSLCISMLLFFKSLHWPLSRRSLLSHPDGHWTSAAICCSSSGGLVRCVVCILHIIRTFPRSLLSANSVLLQLFLSLQVWVLAMSGFPWKTYMLHCVASARAPFIPHRPAAGPPSLWSWHMILNK